MRLSRETLSPAMVLLQIVTVIERYVGMEIAFCQIIFQIDFFHGFSCCAMRDICYKLLDNAKCWFHIYYYFCVFIFAIAEFKLVNFVIISEIN